MLIGAGSEPYGPISDRVFVNSSAVVAVGRAGLALLGLPVYARICVAEIWCAATAGIGSSNPLVRSALVPYVLLRAGGSGPTCVTKVSSLLPALAEISQQPSVGK